MEGDDDLPPESNEGGSQSETPMETEDVPVRDGNTDSEVESKERDGSGKVERDTDNGSVGSNSTVNSQNGSQREEGSDQTISVT